MVMDRSWIDDDVIMMKENGQWSHGWYDYDIKEMDNDDVMDDMMMMIRDMYGLLML
jgi:hypothetical protein